MATGLGTDAQIRTYLSDVLSDEHTIDTRFNDRISQTNGEAEHEIFGTLVGRGYSVAEINTWDLLQETHIELAAMYVLRTVRTRLTDPETVILNETLAKIQTRIRDELPLTQALLTIDSAEHDDNHLPRSQQGPGDDPTEHGREFLEQGSIPGF